ncbi:hypothetical protein NECAME_05748 [Necator americanus]|uniref:Uncharacterized protein n=1 Tax=Necator americanus TaxID=51031 RepID=W2U129_NECAM|nr:hypothetical protein NECAME_05748 [Necator americanus]ETN87027.1 hypothetical protein NECAME_05748 [Necator americanus]
MAACLAEELNAECGEPSGSIIVEALLRPLISTSIILRELGPRAIFAAQQQLPEECYYIVDLVQLQNIVKGIPPVTVDANSSILDVVVGFGKFIRRPSVSIGEAEGIVVIAAGSARGARTGRSAENEQNRLAAQPKHAPAVRQEHLQTAPPQEKKQPKKESKKARQPILIV